MRRRRTIGPDMAVVADAVRELQRKFDYPDELGGGGGSFFGGGGGMAHYLIVSESEVDAVQEKADFLVPDSNSATLLQEAFDSIAATNDTSAVISIWMAGIFDLDSDVTPPDEALIRGLGYNEGGPPCG